MFRERRVLFLDQRTQRFHAVRFTEGYFLQFSCRLTEDCKKILEWSPLGYHYIIMIGCGDHVRSREILGSAAAGTFERWLARYKNYERLLDAIYEHDTLVSDLLVH